MRVVLATRIFSPEPAAASFRLLALVDELAAQGCAVDVLTTRFADSRSERQGPVRVLRAPVRRSADGFVRGYVSYLSFDVPLFFRLLTVRRPRVVVVEPPPTTGLVAALVTGLRRIPMVWYAADIWSDAAVIAGAPRPVVGAVRAAERWVLRRAAAVLAVSDDVARRVAELSGRSAVVVGNGVDTRVFTPAPVVHDPSAPPVFVYAGTSSEFQGAGIFIDALERVRRHHPDTQLVLLGGGHDSVALAARAATAPAGMLAVLPRQPPEIAAHHLRSATASLASIVPGVGYDFAVPTKIFASTACGAPVIFAGPDAAAAEVIRSAPLGWAVAYDAAALAVAMAAAIEVSRAPDAARARERVSQWAHRTGSLAEVARHAASVILDAVR